MNVLGPKDLSHFSTLANLLSQVWYKGLSETNIISSFRATGIFPTNRDKYIQRFDQWLYNRYKHWIELARPGNFNAENETKNEMYNEQLNEEIDKENLENRAPSSTFVENKDLVTKFVRK